MTEHEINGKKLSVVGKKILEIVAAGKTSIPPDILIDPGIYVGLAPYEDEKDIFGAIKLETNEKIKGGES